MSIIQKILIGLLLTCVYAFSSMAQPAGGVQPASGIPEIMFIEFPKLIPSDGSQVIGTLGFRDPDADISAVEFTVVKAVAFPPFGFNPNVKGKVEGIFQFLIFSQLGQQVTLQVTLKDEQGNKSPPKQFSFIAGRLINSRIAFLGQWGSFGLNGGEFDLPRAVAVDKAGNVYVADTGNHRIQKFSPGQQLLATWGSHCDMLQNLDCVDPDGEGPLEVGDGQFSLPHGIAVDRAGNVYVADFGNARIQKFDATGAFLMKWGSRGNGDGQFNQPIGLAVDGEGNVYVSDVGNDRLQKFDATGRFLMRWGSFGAGDGQFHDPRGLAVDGSGNIYVVDSGNHRVQKISPMGAFLKKWGIPGRKDGEFFLPFGVAVDSGGNVYVADALNQRIQKFDADGNFVTGWGGSGEGEGFFNTPTGIAVDADGNIYVTDSVNCRVQKFVGLE